eukprot:COSAG02_NODE_64415_length_260_cov_1.267081_2_plen_24_part_01
MVVKKESQLIEVSGRRNLTPVRTG